MTKVVIDKESEISKLNRILENQSFSDRDKDLARYAIRVIERFDTEEYTGVMNELNVKIIMLEAKVFAYEAILKNSNFAMAVVSEKDKEAEK